MEISKVYAVRRSDISSYFCMAKVGNRKSSQTASDPNSIYQIWQYMVDF